MKILVTGRGGAASWTIRGEQIGAALGATVKPMATLQDMRAHDVILVVKRVPDTLLHDLHRCGRPWAYDVVDAYPQHPAGMFHTREVALVWLRDHLARLQPTSVIWPNQRMPLDAEMAGSVVYHHARPGLRLNPIRERMRTIGYEGHPRYVTDLWPTLQRECAARGLVAQMNPGQLADVDVLLAWRDKRCRDYPAVHWKSNVKLANAHASGTPVICNPESGYGETGTGREYWASARSEVGLALDWLAERETRTEISARFLLAAEARTLENAAAEVREVLRAL